MRTLLAISSLVSVSLLGTACGSQCGLALAERIELDGELSMGESVYREVTLTHPDLQVDLTNSSASGRIDAFLTDANCTKLFDAYDGTRTRALCQILLGPVAAATVSERRKISPGRYRMFAQAWSGNQVPTSFVMDLGIWSDDCRYQSQSPL
jgi:hypothetical protein